MLVLDGDAADVLAYVPLWVDVAAVALGALVGALAAARERFDISGVLTIAIVSGLGGGLIRDVLLGQGPPVALTSAWLLPTAVVVGLATFLASRALDAVGPRMGRLVLVLDAVFLAVFTVVGTAKGAVAGLPAVSCVLLGTITGVGGGVLRDVLLMRQPSVLRPGALEALAAVVGASVQTLVDQVAHAVVGAAIGLVVTVALRLLSVWRRWETPVAPVASDESFRARWVRRWRREDGAGVSSDGVAARPAGEGFDGGDHVDEGADRVGESAGHAAEDADDADDADYGAEGGDDRTGRRAAGEPRS